MSSNTEDSARYNPYTTRPQTRSQTRSQTRFQATNTREEVNTVNSSSLQSVKKRIYLSTKDLDSAKERLLVLPQEESEEEYTESREIILKENVSLDSYLKYRECESNLPVRIYLDNGKIKAYEVPGTPHSTASATIKGFMFSWNHQDLKYGDDATFILGANSAGEPDSWVRPKNRPRPQPGAAANNRGVAYPTMIIEVGHKQSLPGLHRKVALYFSQRTTIQIVLVVKIFELRVNNTIALIAAKYLRTSPNPLVPVQVILFGNANPHGSTVNSITTTMGVPRNNFIGVGRVNPTNGINYPACNRAGIGTYIINIPPAELFNGDPTVQPFTAANNHGFDLDLWEIQDVILDEL